MSTTWFTSDWHLGHKRIVELSHRPYDTIEEHDNALVEMYNARVKPDDIVWFLGDMSVEGSYKHALAIAAQLPGRKRLVTGNHDQAWTGKADFMRFMPEYAAVFDVVTPWARTKVNGVKVNLSHFPYFGDHTDEDRFDMYRLRMSDRPIIHGHTHSDSRFYFEEIWRMDGTSTLLNQVHVGVDAWDYTLVSMNEVAELLK